MGKLKKILNRLTLKEIKVKFPGIDFVLNLMKQDSVGRSEVYESPVSTYWERKIHHLIGNGIEIPLRVFGPSKLNGQVFSINILTQPLSIIRENDNIHLIIDTKNIKYAVYKNNGKKFLCDLFFADDSPIKEEMRSWAKDVDQSIHSFILKKSGNTNKIILDLKDMPLRWASGGVFPIVTYNGGTWTPFFFRDIDPCGWNIPLGASESIHELQNPKTLMWREFIEEFLILCESPELNPNSEIKCKIPDRTDNIDIDITIEEAKQFIKKHINLRNNEKYDNLNLSISEHDTILFRPLKTNNKLHVVSNSSTFLSYDDVLFAINPFELGIEVVTIIKADLDLNDYVLDGEILEGINPHEIVRMPVALINHKYLEKHFKNYEDLIYDGNSQCSIEGNSFENGDIILFNWDIKRRKEIICNLREGVGTEKERYTQWDKRFGMSAIDPNVDIKKYNIPKLFTPTSAKISAYYFASKK